METTIYLIVGKHIRQTQARIVGNVAKVQSPHGTLEFRRFHLTERAAKLALNRKSKRKEKV